MGRFTISSRRVIILMVLTAFLSASVQSQEVIRKNIPAGVCYAGKKVNRIYIPPPKEFYITDKSKGADITVIYSGFTTTTQAAFENAVSILASILPSDAHFTIKANLEAITESGVLGQTSVPSVYKGSGINGLFPDLYYPVSLAEKIIGGSLNFETEPDIELTLNSRGAWYTGINGNTPENMYDMVTVVIHELCHGLGFFDSFYVDNEIGSYGQRGYPPVTIYDSFIETKKGLQLIDPDNFDNSSKLLGDQLTGNALYFDGPLVSRYTFGIRPRIFAPEEFDPGSSISHLDEDATATKDQLMTPYISLGEAIHSPGDLTLSILGDLGWVNTRVIHEPFHDTESYITEADIKAVVESDTIFDRDHVGLVYSFDNFVSSDTLFLVTPVSDDTFRISLDIPSYEIPVSYFLYVVDTFDRNYHFPSRGKDEPYTFFVGTDTVRPKLNHARLGDYYDRTPSLLFRAIATDNIGVDTVYIEYTKNIGVLKSFGLKNDSSDNYSGTLNLLPESVVEGDSIRYRIIAVDKSSSANSVILPSTGYYSIHFNATFPVVNNYATDFSDASTHFLNTGFSITTPSQFTNPGLNTVHPYESPETDDGTIEYTAYLRDPVKIDTSGLFISYDEIVLVEPGEPGSFYGSQDFYDYVIVEGSKDLGLTWFPLADGYDCRVNSAFVSAYNSEIIGMNSTAAGTPDLFRSHIIDIRTFDKFNKGDTLLIRFRLYSDPYAHGWGWAIDNLVIGSVTDGIDDLAKTQILIYPNPGNGRIFIDPRIAESENRIDYIVYNTAGIPVLDGTLGYTGNEIDISKSPPGMYIILFKSGRTVSYAKYTKLW